MKYWINPIPKEHSFVVHANRNIYRLKAKPEEIIDLRQELGNGRINDKFLGVPESYLRYIEFQENSPSLTLHYGKDTEDEILISDNGLRREIFEYLREHTSENTFEAKRLSLFSRIRKPAIALLIVLIICSGVGYFLWEAQLGNYYTVEGSRPGLIGLIIGLAELGIIINSLIFLPLMSLCIYLIVRAASKQVLVERILYRRF